MPGYALPDDEKPVILSSPSDEELKKLYPPEALKEGLEMDIDTKLMIDFDGSVVRVTVVKDPGHGFAEAAKKVGRKIRFKPAKHNGQAVATEIPFRVRFSVPQ